MDDLTRQPLTVIEQRQSEKLRAMLDLCLRGHPYYRRVWADANINVSQIQTMAHLQQLPLTHKSDLMGAPDRFRLHLPELPLQERTLWEIIYTTGSTTDPTPLYNTTHDYNAYLFQSQRVAAISGIRETDVIANLLPLTPAPMGAFARSAANAYAAGATIFAALPGASYGPLDVRRPLDEAVRLIEFIAQRFYGASRVSYDASSCVRSRSVPISKVSGCARLQARPRRRLCAKTCAAVSENCKQPATQYSTDMAPRNLARLHNAVKMVTGTIRHPNFNITRSSILGPGSDCQTANAEPLP